MIESTTITLPKEMPLTERFSEVNRHIAEWIESLDKPFNYDTDQLQMAKYSSDESEYFYRYIIERDAKSLKRKR